MYVQKQPLLLLLEISLPKIFKKSCQNVRQKSLKHICEGGYFSEIAVHQLVSLLKMDSFTVFFEDFAY